MSKNRVSILYIYSVENFLIFTSTGMLLIFPDLRRKIYSWTFVDFLPLSSRFSEKMVHFSLKLGRKNVISFMLCVNFKGESVQATKFKKLRSLEASKLKKLQKIAKLKLEIKKET